MPNRHHSGHHSEERLAIARGEPAPPSLLGWLRVALRLLSILALLIAFVPLHYFFRLVRYGSPFPKWFLAALTRIAGARVRRVGTPLRRDVVFISNHVSWLDIAALAGASGTAFVSKAELAKTPVVGWLASLNRTVYVQRENRMGVAEQINQLREALLDNWSITVFPEGTTTDGHSLLPFKSSMLSVLETPPPGVMVQPVVLDYREISEWIGWIGEESGAHNALRVLARRGTFRLDLHFLDPFSPGEHGNRKAIAQASRKVIEQRLVETRGGAPLRDFAHTVEAIRYTPPDED